MKTAAALATLFILIVSIAVAGPAAAQNNSSLRGQVTDARNHQPLEGVRTVLYNLHGTKPIASTFTDRGGSFRLDGLRSGLYRLEFSKPGYRGLAIEGIGVRANEIMVIAGSVALSAGNASLAAAVARAENGKCGSLVQPGVTADVYVVCAGH